MELIRGNEEGRGIMKKVQAKRVENQVYSNQVVRSEFDQNWRTTVSKSGYVIYTARNHAKVTVLLSTGVSHYSSPTKEIQF